MLQMVPLFISSAQTHLPILIHYIEKGEIGREQAKQQEKQLDSAARSAVARAERIACCVGQQQYCVSGFSLPVPSPL